MTTAEVTVRARTDPATARLATQLRDAHEARTPLRIVGGGHWLDAGRPLPSAAVPLPVRELSGIVEYVPGDLTLTARAGTPLAELHEATRANGQRLALDPYGPEAGTLGATLATASAGPLAGAFGTPRDNVLGVTLITGAGEVVRGGGRVVKNVAGFDLVRLATGAWGTLGVLTEASVRLRALPERDETLVVPIDADDTAHVARAAATLRALPFTFDALELLDAMVAKRLGLGEGNGALLVRVSGSGALVHAMHAALGAAGQVRGADPAHWATLRALEPAGAATLRLSHLASRLADLWRTAQEVATTAGGWAHLALGRRVARVTIPRRAGESDSAFGSRVAGVLALPLARFDGTCRGERLPREAWAVLPRATDAGLARLTRGVRLAFDPQHLLNPGILGAAGGEA